MSKKSDEAILFPDRKVGDIIVKPWTFGKLFEVSPFLESVLDKVEAKGIDKELNIDGILPFITMAKIFTVASAELLEVMSLSLDISIENLKELDMNTGIKLAMALFEVNKETIKNAFSSLTIMTETEGEQKEKKK